MALANIDSLTLNELWSLHDEIAAILTSRLTEEKRRLEEQLVKLHTSSVPGLNPQRQHRLGVLGRARRPYPQVLPKYRNPMNPAETWAGRGKQPRWLRDQLKSGKRIENFLIVRKTRQSDRKRAAR
jgi:DNA-binding protein H-NS